MIYRRQRWQSIFGVVLAVVAVLNILFYLILNRPAQSEYFSLQYSIEILRTQTKGNELALKNLETRNQQIDRFDQDRQTLLMKYFLPRQTGYSQILTELDDIVRRTGVKKSRVTLPIEDTQYGMSTLTITLPVEGSYSNIVSFVRELERSDVFLLINGIDVTASEAALESGTPGGATISLGVTMQTYFYQ